MSSYVKRKEGGEEVEFGGNVSDRVFRQSLEKEYEGNEDLREMKSPKRFEEVRRRINGYSRGVHGQPFRV